MSSPFNKKKGGTATAEKPTADDLATGEVANVGEENTAPAAKADPFAGGIADPSGISGLKPIAFMNQLVALHAVETGRRVTANSGNEEDGKSPYAVFDLIPITVPEEGGEPTKEKPVRRGDEVVVLNKDGDPESFEAYEVGERLDDLMFFNKPLVAEAAKALRKGHQWVLGRITYGEKKPNQSRPIILRVATPEDKALFEEWRASRG
ncbi:hypothetical protein SEA_KNOCKER_51 [Mycobacterium phage Knocker]|nr:hypothetical protein SEA_KNOCKER_51 [Mycobacterium phage Knocker]